MRRTLPPFFSPFFMACTLIGQVSPTLWITGNLLLLIAPIQVHAASPCPICLNETDPSKAPIRCTQGHPSHSECLEHQMTSFLPKNAHHAQDLLSHGLPCCTEGCPGRIPLETLHPKIHPKIIVEFQKRLQFSPAREQVSHPTPSSLSPKVQQAQSLRLFRDQIQEAFNLTCPGCGQVLAPIEGCNAATCDVCGTQFCYLCLKIQPDTASAHAHAREHSGNYWERRDAHSGRVPPPGQGYSEYEMIPIAPKPLGFLGWVRSFFQPPSTPIPATGASYTYVHRYHWLIARKKLQQIAETNTVPPAVRTSVVQSLESFLRKNKMWPLPTEDDAEVWIQKVLTDPLLDERNRSILLHNEWIFLNSEKPQSETDSDLSAPGSYFESETDPITQRAQKIALTLRERKAPHFQSLDLKDDPRDRLDVMGRRGNPRFFVLPVIEGGDIWNILPQEFREIGWGNLYQIQDPTAQVPDFILSDRAPQPMNHWDATDYCETRGAPLPSQKQLEALGRAMGVGQEEGFNPHLIPHMNQWSDWLWSSTLYSGDPQLTYYFFGGHTNLVSRSINRGKVRCAMTLF